MSLVSFASVSVPYSNCREYLLVVGKSDRQRLVRLDPKSVRELGDGLIDFKTRVQLGSSSIRQALELGYIQIGEESTQGISSSEREGLLNTLRFYDRIKHALRME
jgi:hypothetical protein